MKVNRRLVILSALLLVVAAAAVKLSHGEDESPAISEPAERQVTPQTRQISPTPARTGDLALDKLARGEMSVGEINPFTPKSWYVPPPPPPVQAPPKPTAPPIPFSYVGKLEEDGGNWTVYLSKGNESFVIKKGDTFDNNYRFDGVENGNLVILYLPLSVKQTISIGEGF